ncbi:hypothetical protein FRC12_002481 [Ceratobasidium sp. 428]|nr:hypothetical protein FRC12_002481 [Ceratobasidium sp. 428]
MFHTRTFFSTPLIFLSATCGSAEYTWPNPVLDEIEHLTHVQDGPFGSGIIGRITPCRTSQSSLSNQPPADWLRTAFHNVISYDAATGAGGLDASLQWETDRAENRGGRSFNDTIEVMVKLHNTRATMADLLALAAYSAVGSCGGPKLAMKAGRIDATGPGPEGRVPKPSGPTPTMIQKFANVGFNQQEMIQVAFYSHCSSPFVNLLLYHRWLLAVTVSRSVNPRASASKALSPALGGVHQEDFPELSPRKSFPEFDTTENAFDNRVVTEYLDGTTKNPLVLAPGGNNSDFKVLNSDGNSTIHAMSAPQSFTSRCQSILQRMIDTVPSSVQLSSPLTPLVVKPHLIQLQLLSNGKIQLGGYIRVMVQGVGIPSVKLILKDRDGKPVLNPLETRLDALGKGLEASFRFFKIASNTLDSGISSFDISVTSITGVKTLYTNNGGGYPIQDKIILQQPQSCLTRRVDNSGSKVLALAAALKNDILPATPQMDVVVRSSRPGTLVPQLSTISTQMKLWKNTTFGYTLYNSTFNLPTSSWSTTVGVWVQVPGGIKYEDASRSTDNFPGDCAAF